MPFGYPVILELAGRRRGRDRRDAVREGKVEGLLAADVGSTCWSSRNVRPARLDDSRRWTGVDGRASRVAACRSRRRVRVRRLGRTTLPNARDRARSARPRGPGERHGRHPQLRLGRARRSSGAASWSWPISTGGASPALAKQLRAAALRDVRRGMVRDARRPAQTCARRPCRSSPTSRERARRWSIRAGLDGGGGARPRAGEPTSCASAWSRTAAGGARVAGSTGTRLTWSAPARATRSSSRSAAPRSWRRADVVVYDRLASPGAPRPGARRRPSASTSARSRAAPRCRRTRSTRCSSNARSTGRRRGATQGRRPVRVRSRRRGDCSRASRPASPCEVVPGITSAVAAPALAGIPVTHRGVAQSLRGRHGVHRPRRRRSTSRGSPQPPTRSSC